MGDRTMWFGLLTVGIALALILDQVRTGGYYRASVVDMIERSGARIGRVFR